AVVTDRDELDEQIERVFTEAGETIYRTDSGRDLMRQLGRTKPRLLCSLVHKFGPRGDRMSDEQFNRFVEELESGPSKTVGDVFVFVDECHRTQTGRLHRVMKAMMPNAIFIGFTGTPLLRRDSKTTLETFGSYIHTYKFDEAVEDQVVLDLVYEARDIDQRLGAEDKIDAWFEAKTQGLNAWQKDELQKHWGTLQKVLSSRSRMERVGTDILFDFNVKPRLSSERGNAMLVASSIYEACKYFDLFQKTPFKGLCAVVTSYNPHVGDVALEETGANSETDKQFIYATYEELLRDVVPKPNMTKTETYEHDAKALFVHEPARMRLLIVVDKLLTGFDAPSCTYLYIDKTMNDHGLFQAICRTNRLDGEDKDFGYIVDYKDLFRKVENAIAVYTSELDTSADGSDPQVLLEDRLTKGHKRVDEALEALALLCEPVEPPKGELEHIHYFCGNTEVPDDLKKREPLRANLYKATASLVRAFAGICDELLLAGYSPEEIAQLKHRVKQRVNLRELIRRASGESLDLKPYEADMRHLIDMYIEADEARKVSPWNNMTLLDLIVKSGIAEAINSLPDNIRGDRNAAAETIENNVRKKIIKSHLSDPAFYAKMSALLDEIIKQRKAEAIAYEEYLKRIGQVARQVADGKEDNTPVELDTPGKRALFNNLMLDTADSGRTGVGEPGALLGTTEAGHALAQAVALDAAIRASRPDGWRGHKPRENVIKMAMHEILGDEAAVERLFVVIRGQSEY
ncbi:MAG: HsdR family type I site-specific deoxyribonuclease, partial [Lentisphaerae bacterium]|nr:HsdR family type I site-specific deoxyribonuclease [Lentisphaerota bacterium]